MKRAKYAATAVAFSAVFVTLGGSQPVQAKEARAHILAPLPQITCDNVTATVNYSKPFFLQGTTSAVETSNNIKLGSEGLAHVPCLGDTSGKGIVGGHGFLVAQKVGNCVNVTVNGVAHITWTNARGQDVGTSEITYTAAGPIVDTVILGGTVTEGDTFLNNEVTNNSINDDNVFQTAAECASNTGVLTQSGGAQLILTTQ
ncbi:hypothetical protein MOV08_07685 [Streptomyces yunnanensis]|uniref:Secreted protein n=1 Tax=Streptomyces yunnanensis TaxID=156453 RepID=A0ABY8A2Q7_9ACTN|nr:hypothetical protein [Streptomyces yunnanensis]WEB39178.1 hypothetical protein MOV08_07685 [Streptomyces yunnanensis]